MQKKLISFLLNQYFIAFSITLAVILYIPNYFTKYNIELKESNSLQRPTQRVYFKDLNNDGNSEKIICYKNNKGNACFEIENADGGIIDQWNFKHKFNGNHHRLYFADANDNGFNEIYLFTQQQDSVFLNISEPLVKKGIHKTAIFIDVIGIHNRDLKSSTNSLSVGTKKNNNGVKDIYFDLTAGFSGTPRNVYKYNVSSNALLKSPHLTNTLSITSIKDINNDGFDEILFSGYANGNEIDTCYTSRSDYCSWITVLDHNLNFLFEPIEVQIPFSKIHTIPLKIGSNFKLATLIDSRGHNNESDKIQIYSTKGILEKTMPLPKGYYNLFSTKNNKKFILNN